MEHDEAGAVYKGYVAIVNRPNTEGHIYPPDVLIRAFSGFDYLNTHDDVKTPPHPLPITLAPVRDPTIADPDRFIGLTKSVGFEDEGFLACEFILSPGADFVLDELITEGKIGLIMNGHATLAGKTKYVDSFWVSQLTLVPIEKIHWPDLSAVELIEPDI